MHQCAHHHTENQNYGSAFAIGVVLNVAFVLVEAGYGFYSHSLALLADAGHNLSDVLGLLIAWGGYALAKVPPCNKRTYGWRSTTILAALVNALILLVAIGGIAWEAIHRFQDPADVAAPTVIIVALIGVVINTITALLFMKGRHGDLNIRGAFLHMAADALLSLGVAVAGVLILYTQWNWIDPATSLLIAVVIFVATTDLLRESVNYALQAVPKKIDLDDVSAYLLKLPGVTAVHDLHVWAMSTTEIALTAHLVKPQLENNDALLKKIAHDLDHEFQISHATVQIESSVDAANCRQAEAGSL
ncbi:cation efflux system protein [Rhodopirellula maiorica SM1]|uniref:Cation efflux system protein n=1 Tax=Rhodopirellula maiorica SM1 TaxID=1265738 RepID=M5RU05_9BACT|nr:cation diffusion facilitator family transporter [Rhodopirellula maiorica]EMI22808.1 cation efflux system protein [Rhodopirellula maiorica SM1]